jgi:methylglutaconyl-CoA hydratase
MPENGSVTLEKENHIGTIEFYHPKANSLPAKLLRQLAEKITQADKDNDVRVIVLRSKGEGAFCAGASFDELIAIEDVEQGKRFFMGFALVMNAMREASKLIIVRVQGRTVGGGVGIAAAGDYTFAHKTSAIKLSELSLGIGPFVVGPAVKRKMGVAALSTLAIDATNWYNAEWARDEGLYARVLQTQDLLDDAVDELAESLAKSSPKGMKMLKRTLWQDTGYWEAQLEKRAAINGKLVLSDFTRKFIDDFKKERAK